MTIPLLVKAQEELNKMDPILIALALRKYTTLRPVITLSPMLGCDPEFFFSSNKGEIVGAEKVLDKQGLINKRDPGLRPLGMNEKDWEEFKRVNTSKFIIDGVAAEINPRPQTCRAYHANDIAQCMRLLKETLTKDGNKVKPIMGKVVVEVSKEELKSLDEENRKFGCAPSNNLYNPSATIQADPETYLKRGAGGHIHLGNIDIALKNGPEELVWLLDLLVGNTSVLCDRNPDNVERRKNYGRAGEYRLPKHGLEYRTLSNFWLYAYPLMSLVFGMARYAVEVASDQSINGIAVRKAYKEAVNPKNIEKAIQENDFNLALTNYLSIEPIIVRATSEGTHSAITQFTSGPFLHFVEMIEKHGLSYWFKQDPLDHWCNLPDAHGGGIYDYLSVVVKNNIEKQTKHPLISSEPKALLNVFNTLGDLGRSIARKTR